MIEEEIDLTDDNALYKERKVEDGNISFKNVSFRYYKNSEENVLSNISFDVKSGQTLGIIGPTGSGKTTLVSLISRLYDVDAGEVCVDGVNVKEYSLDNLRNGIGMVLQKIRCFREIFMKISGGAMKMQMKKRLHRQRQTHRLISL